jgi:hypothetical protein
MQVGVDNTCSSLRVAASAGDRKMVVAAVSAALTRPPTFILMPRPRRAIARGAVVVPQIWRNIDAVS